MGDARSLVGLELEGGTRIARVACDEAEVRLYEATGRGGEALTVRVVHACATPADEVDALRADLARLAAAKVAKVLLPTAILPCPDGLALVYPRTSGEPLATRLKRVRRASGERAASLVRAIVSVLDGTRAAGVSHGALSPWSILVGEDGELSTLLDFGLGHLGRDARRATSRTQGFAPATASPVGYLAPEQLRGAEPGDERCDVFALGAVLYHAVEGRAPFGTGTSRAIAARLLHAEPPPTVEVSRDVERIALRALAKPRDARFPSLKALLEAINGPYPLRVKPTPAQVAAVAAQVRAEAATTISATVEDTPEQQRANATTLPPLAERERERQRQQEADDEELVPARRKPWLPLAGVAVLAVGVILYLALAGGTKPVAGAPQPPRPNPPAASASVEVELDVTPGGAQVLVDGREVRGIAVTLPRGARPLPVTVAAPGYASFSTSIVPDKDKQLVVHLEQLAPTAPTVLRPRRPTPDTPASDTAPAPDPFAAPATKKPSRGSDLKDPFGAP